MPGPLLELVNIQKSFGKGPVLRGVGLDVQKGETAVIIGASGSGKSTLLRCAALLETPDEGEIILDGEILWSSWREGRVRGAASERVLARKRANFGFVFQQLNLFPHMTAMGNTIEGLLTVKRLSSPQAREIGSQMLQRVGLADKANRYPRELSGGEQQRVAMARALAMQPKVLIMDEPTSALDPELVAEVLDVTAELAKQGMTMLVVSHEMGFAYEVADRVLFICEGIIGEQGEAKQVLRFPATAPLQSFLRRFHYSGTLFADGKETGSRATPGASSGSAEGVLSQGSASPAA